MTLNMVRALHQRGIVSLHDDVFTQRITANPGAELGISQANTGPVGTSMTDLEAG